ncbi:MAG TPA: UDP-N-acetylmuramoyl-L-alanine--D-glutamate ligase [Chloroflexota bacterium]|nr:UDP-N-acetylmuramoyl-L-alanine--D-glutamate ligase [Chloroflexota bacterium]
MSAAPALTGRRALVVGLGREGEDLARFLVARGARVHVTDSRPPEALAAARARLAALPLRYTLGEHPLALLDDCDIVYLSPGVPRTLPLVTAAQARGIPLSSATELFLRLCPARTIGITGSSGKTTTTALVGEMLRAARWPVLVGGNIGVPLLGRLDELTPEHWVVLELSSFQLEPLRQSPHIAAITNLTPNHLDRHGTMEAYAAAKFQITAHQGPHDWAVLNADDARVAAAPGEGRRRWFSLVRPVEGAYLAEGWLVEGRASGGVPLVSRATLRLRGQHNVANALCAAAVALAAGVPVAAIRAALARFRGVPHRLEEVAVIDGVTYVNDSIATSPERAIAALESFEAPIVLLAGGRDKHLPWDRWAQVVGRRVRALLVWGEAADLISTAARAHGAAHVPLDRVATLDEAVARARQLARPGDVVLLSPGCTSYDQFRDFEERGARFRALVQALRGQEVPA